MQQQEIKQPPIYLFMVEFVRSMMERAQSWSFRRNYTPNRMGDGHPVLVIPGILAHDFQMEPMRRFLERLNYKTFPWELGFNLADTEEIDILEERVEKLMSAYGRKVSIIGWSLGGIYGRDLARRRPELIRQVITLGSPFRGIDKPSRASWIFYVLKGNIEELIDKDWLKTFEVPINLLSTCIYSRTDGVLPWQYCLDPIEDELHRNYEVQSSHLGLPQNIQALKIIAQNLPDNPD